MIVVIAILATITIVGYSGITTRAHSAATQTDLANFNTKLQLYYINNQSIPDSLASMSDFGGVATNGVDCGSGCPLFGSSASVLRGKYGLSYDDVDKIVTITYWDYTAGNWAEQYWQDTSDGSLNGPNQGVVQDYPKGPCKQQDLKACAPIPE